MRCDVALVAVYYASSVVFQIMAIIFMSEGKYLPAIISAAMCFHPIVKGVCK